MGIITRFFGKSKSSKKAQTYLDDLSSPTSNTPSSRFSKLGRLFTGKGTTRHRKRHRRGVVGTRRKRRRY